LQLLMVLMVFQLVPLVSLRRHHGRQQGHVLMFAYCHALSDDQACMSPQVKAAEVVRLANQAESAKRKAERARQEESELQVRCTTAAALHIRIVQQMIHGTAC
jgi:hypothetical protein